MQIFLLLIALTLLHLASPLKAWSFSIEKTITVKGVGAAQGISERSGYFYIYGDLVRNNQHVGVIKELDKKLQPTGKQLLLLKNGKPVLRHPTGLTFHPRWNTVMGDTVNGAGTIYQLNWQRMWKDGNLDNAIKAVINDDLAKNGTRPEFVKYNGKEYLATADYGDKSPEIRLYNPYQLFKEKKSSGLNVLAAKSACTAFTQNIHWDEKRHQIVLVQNITAGLGWRLDKFDINKLFNLGPIQSRISKTDIKELQISGTELEGFRPINESLAVFVTSSNKDNLILVNSWNCSSNQ